MNGLYQILLFLFIFGCGIQSINELHVFPTSIQVKPVGISEATVTDFQDGATGQPPSEFDVWQIVSSFMRVVGAGVISLLGVGVIVYGVCTSVGADPAFATAAAGMIQAPVTFVTLFGLYEWWTGRSVT